MKHDPATIEEYEARKQREREKALEKYGPDALQPEGDLTRDVLDYAINELVGLDRYAEMIENRSQQISTAHIAARLTGVEVAYELRKVARQQAMNVIVLRNFLKSKGLLQGAAETR